MKERRGGKGVHQREARRVLLFDDEVGEIDTTGLVVRERVARSPLAPLPQQVRQNALVWLAERKVCGLAYPENSSGATR